MATRMPGTHYYKQVSHYSFEVFFIFQISTNNSLYVIILRRQPYFLPSLIFWLGYHCTKHFATMILTTIFPTVSLSLNIILVFSSVIYDRHVWVLSRSGMSNSLLPLDCSPSGSSVHGICQARVLECTASPSSRRSSRPRIKPASHASLRWQAASLPLSHLERPICLTQCPIIKCQVMQFLFLKVSHTWFIFSISIASLWLEIDLENIFKEVFEEKQGRLLYL